MHTGRERLDRTLNFLPVFENGRSLGRATQQRADLTLRARTREMFHRARSGKEEKQECAFTPATHERRPKSDRQHEEMNFELAAAEPPERSPSRIPSAGNVADAEERQDDDARKARGLGGDS